jgi:hypothetical protein
MYEHEWDQAAEMYWQALEIQLDYARAYMGLGTISSIQGEYEEAARYGELAIVSEEDYALAHYSLGVNHYRLGNKEEAVSAFEDCLSFVGANEGLQSAAEQNLALAKQLPAASTIPIPSPTQTTTPTPTPTLSSTLTPIPTQTAAATPTPIHLTTRANNTTSTSTPTSVSTSTPTPTSSPTATATPTPTPYPAPQLIDPPDGMTIVGGLTRFAWTWESTLGPDEYFDLKIRPLGDPNSAFVAWSKEPDYILDARTAQLEETKIYVWTIQVLRGHYDGKKRVFETFLSPESDGFIFRRGVIHGQPDDPGTGERSRDR